jgi:hypothetical protein
MTFLASLGRTGCNVLPRPGLTFGIAKLNAKNSYHPYAFWVPIHLENGSLFLAFRNANHRGYVLYRPGGLRNGYRYQLDFNLRGWFL